MRRADVPQTFEAIELAHSRQHDVHDDVLQVRMDVARLASELFSRDRQVAAHAQVIEEVAAR